MAVMNVFISLVVIIIVFTKVGKTITKTSQNAEKRVQQMSNIPAQRRTSQSKNTGVSKGMTGGTSGSAQTVKEKRTTLSTLSRTMENRDSDWLAKQLADERVAKRRMSDMMDLRQSHMDNCDARDARFDHMNNCDAGGIDDGEH